MLRGIDPLLTPDLLKILREMGHGDEIAIVDANYPAATDARRLVRLPGADTIETLRAVLSVLPLDTYVDCAAHCMAVVGDPDRIEPIMVEFQTLIDEIAAEDDEARPHRALRLLRPREDRLRRRRHRRAAPLRQHHPEKGHYSAHLRELAQGATYPHGDAYRRSPRQNSIGRGRVRW